MIYRVNEAFRESERFNVNMRAGDIDTDKQLSIQTLTDQSEFRSRKRL